MNLVNLVNLEFSEFILCFIRMSFTCKLCNLSFNKQRKLWRHNYSREHIEKINQIEDNIIEITDSIRQKSKRC